MEKYKLSSGWLFISSDSEILTTQANEVIANCHQHTLINIKKKNCNIRIDPTKIKSDPLVNFSIGKTRILMAVACV